MLTLLILVTTPFIPLDLSNDVKELSKSILELVRRFVINKSSSLSINKLVIWLDKSPSVSSIKLIISSLLSKIKIPSLEITGIEPSLKKFKSPLYATIDSINQLLK